MNARINIHFGGFNHIERDWDGVTYHGTNWRLCYNLTSGAHISTRNESISVEPDHIYLLPPKLSYTTKQKNNPKQFYLHFDAASPFDQVQCKVYVIKMNALQKGHLTHALKEAQPAPFFLSDSGMMHALALVASCLSEIPAVEIHNAGMDPRIEESIEYLRAHVHQPITVESVASICGMSRGAFTRLFKDETGSTPHSYLTELRIRWARELLAGNEVSIDRIADYTGFTDRFHFTKVFKKQTGLTPAAYRKGETSDSN